MLKHHEVSRNIVKHKEKMSTKIYCRSLEFINIYTLRPYAFRVAGSADVQQTRTSSLTSYGAACHELHKKSKVPSISMNSLALDSNLIIYLDVNSSSLLFLAVQSFKRYCSLASTQSVQTRWCLSAQRGVMKRPRGRGSIWLHWIWFQAAPGMSFRWSSWLILLSGWSRLSIWCLPTWRQS